MSTTAPEKRWPTFAVQAACITLLIAHAGLLALSALWHSPVLNEVGNLPAGISHWHYGRFDLYRVNPPLVRMIAALPVLLSNPATDWRNYSYDPLTRSESDVAIDFVTVNGCRTFWLYTIGRWACIPFACFGAWVCYRWARELYGLAPGVVAAALWCFDPNILGNGSLIMPDVPSAALGAAACYTYWRWLKCATWARSTMSGVMLGMAELTKTTLIIFYPLWVLLWIIYRPPGRRTKIGNELMMLGSQIVLSIYIINMGYGFEGSFKPLGDYWFKSNALAGLPAQNHRLVAGNRFSDTWLASVPVVLPKNYVQGIDAQKFDFEHGMRSYLGGQWSNRGWWYFYLYALCIKEPLGTLMLVLLATGITCLPSCRATLWRDELMVLLPLIVTFAFVSSQTGIGAHFRYALPSVPYLFIFGSKAAASLGWLSVQRMTLSGYRDVSYEGKCWDNLTSIWTNCSEEAHACGHRARFLLTMTVSALTAAALTWTVGSSLRYYPHSLAFFNEFVGGPNMGHSHLLGSSIDWGQDLLYLKDWYETHPHARPFYFASYNSVDLRIGACMFESATPPFGPTYPGTVTVADEQELGPLPGWFAVDVYYLHSDQLSRIGEREGLTSLSQEQFGLSYFGRFQPIERIGYSIYIYKISYDEANRVRHELGLSEVKTK